MDAANSSPAHGNHGHGPDTPARIGPNAILRMLEAMDAGPGRATAEQVFRHAGLAAYLTTPPAEMVDEREVTALHRAARELLGNDQARALARDAGRRTAEYLLANRIPRPAQRILKLLPAPLAARMLMSAMSKNAWTFAGSATFTTRAGNPHRLSIAGCPICRGAESQEPLCDFYGATFEHLFRVLVHAGTQVTEVECQAQERRACIFEVRAARHN